MEYQMKRGESTIETYFLPKNINSTQCLFRERKFQLLYLQDIR